MDRLHMDKKHRQFSIGYFIAAFLVTLLIQDYLSSRHVEIITYSQFKSLLAKGLITDVAIGDNSIEGSMRGEAVKEILSAEQLEGIPLRVKEGKETYRLRRCA